jgi:hypothetical protein
MDIWVHPYTARPVQVGGGLWGLGADLSPSDVVMSLLRLQQASDWIPHPYWMYTKYQCCFVEAIPGLSLDPTSILGVYKVF